MEIEPQQRVTVIALIPLVLLPIQESQTAGSRICPKDQASDGHDTDSFAGVRVLGLKIYKIHRAL